MRVLVTGATGFVGRDLSGALRAAGHEVVALARGERTADAIEGVRFVRGSVLDPASVRAAAEGCDAAVHLVAIIVERGAQTFDRVNHRGTADVVNALTDAGVERLVHMSALGVGDDVARYPYLHTKWLGEEAVRASALDWTILRPGVVVGPGAGFFRPIVWSLRWMPFYPLPRGGRTRFQPITIDDLVRCTVAALEGTASRETVELGGPEVLTFRDLAVVTARALGKRRRMVSIPLWAARPFAFLQGFRRDPLVTNDQLDMVVLDNVGDLEEVQRTFGFEPARIEETDLRWLAEL